MKNKWLCLPKQTTATKAYACTKVLLMLIFLMVFVFEVYWTVTCMRVYRQKIVDLKAATRWPSRSEIQVYSTHSHFFLFTGLLSGATVLIGFWGILMEYLVVLAAFSYIQGGIVFFEIIGAMQSNDEDVQLFKAFGIAPEPILVILGLVFAHMIRVCERKLAESPLYKKQMADRMSKGETGTNVNTKTEKKRASIESDDTTDEAGDNNNTYARDNLAYDIDEEIGKTALDPGVRKLNGDQGNGNSNTALPPDIGREGNQQVDKDKPPGDSFSSSGEHHHNHSVKVTVEGKDTVVSNQPPSANPTATVAINMELRNGS